MLLRNAIKVSGYVDLLQHLALKLRYSPVLLKNVTHFVSSEPPSTHQQDRPSSSKWAVIFDLVPLTHLKTQEFY